MPITQANSNIELPDPEKESLINSLDKTNLDLESPKPMGGPINDPESNYQHKYTGTNTYLDNFQSAASPNSGFGIEGVNIKKNNIFKKTNLDLENPSPLGGPNRTNSEKIPTGQYLNIGTHNITDEKGEVTLKEKDGKEVITQLHRWTPTNGYIKSKDWKNKFPDPPNTNKKFKDVINNKISGLGSSVLDAINSLNPFPNA